MLKEMNYEEILSKTKVLEYYDILVNEENAVLVQVTFKIPGEPDSPKFYYSGGDHGILMKNKRTIILCDYIHTDIHDLISNCSKILFVETPERDNYMPEYEADLIEYEGLDALCKQLLADIEKRREK